MPEITEKNMSSGIVGLAWECAIVNKVKQLSGWVELGGWGEGFSVDYRREVTRMRLHTVHRILAQNLMNLKTAVLPIHVLQVMCAIRQ